MGMKPTEAVIPSKLPRWGTHRHKHRNPCIRPRPQPQCLRPWRSHRRGRHRRMNRIPSSCQHQLSQPFSILVFIGSQLFSFYAASRKPDDGRRIPTGEQGSYTTRPEPCPALSGKQVNLFSIRRLITSLNPDLRVNSIVPNFPLPRPFASFFFSPRIKNP